MVLLKAHTKSEALSFPTENLLTESGKPGRIDVELIGEAWRQVARAANDPAIGIHAVQDYFQPASWRSVGLAMLCSSSIREALERLERYNRFLTDAVEIEMIEGDGYLDYEMQLSLPPELIGYEVIDFGGAAILKMLRMIYPGPLMPVKVYLARPEPEDTASYLSYFGEGVTFAQSKLGFRFTSEQVDTLSLAPNGELAGIQDRLTEDYLARLNNDSVSLKAKKTIIAMLPSGDVTALEVADKLNMSVRNLQRKLSSESTSFKDLLEEVRSTLVVEYLMDPRHSMNEIAYLLGFSDHSNFARAFRRWFNMSPSEKRQELLAG